MKEKKYTKSEIVAAFPERPPHKGCIKNTCKSCNYQKGAVWFMNNLLANLK